MFKKHRTCPTCHSYMNSVALLRLLKFVVSVHCNLQYKAFRAWSCNCLSLFCETNLTVRHVWPKEITEICHKVWRNCHKSVRVVNYKEFWAVSQIATAFFLLQSATGIGERNLNDCQKSRRFNEPIANEWEPVCSSALGSSLVKFDVWAGPSSFFHTWRVQLSTNNLTW